VAIATVAIATVAGVPFLWYYYLADEPGETKEERKPERKSSDSVACCLYIRAFLCRFLLFLYAVIMVVKRNTPDPDRNPRIPIL